LKRTFFANIAAGAIFLFLGYMVIWQTYVETLIDLPAPYSAALVKPVPAAGMPLLRGAVTSDGRPLVAGLPDIEDRIAMGNHLTPLHPYPYIWKARKLAEKQKFEEAITLLEFAKKRNPRSYPVRRLLAEYYLLTNNVEESLQEMFSSALLNPEWGPQFMEAVRLLGANAQLRPRVIAQIASQPDWSSRFFAQLDPEKADDPFVIELSTQVPPNARYRRQLIVRLSKRGLYREALALWLQNTGFLSGKTINWPYDPEFKSMAGTPPFNWAIINSANARAEMAQSSTWDNEQALYVYYFGRKQTPIIRQVMMATPGRYTATIPYAIRTHEGLTTRLRWTVTCKPGNERIGNVVLDKDAKEAGDLRFDYTVPAVNCEAQELVLSGEAGGRTGQMDVEFRSVHSAITKGAAAVPIDAKATEKKVNQP